MTAVAAMFALHLTVRMSTSHRRSVHMFWTSGLCRPVGALGFSRLDSMTLLSRAERMAEESGRNTMEAPHAKKRTAGCRHKRRPYVLSATSRTASTAAAMTPPLPRSSSVESPNI